MLRALLIAMFLVPAIAQAAPPTVAVPAGWIHEDPAVARTLPRRARAVSERWTPGVAGTARHCYEITADVRGARRLKAALTRLGARDEEGVLVMRTPGSIATALRETARFCFDHADAAWAKEQPAIAAAVAPLRPARSLLDLLGAAEVIERGHVAGSAPGVKLEFARAGIDVDALDAWATGRRLAGDRRTGWFGTLEDDLRIVVSLETRDGREVVVVEAALPP
ncbi:MAG: hypothetical protein JNK64_02595 [Myxococcales bacterium]|nr:hypothetical protein [Myxococcales bacterium]